MKKIFLSVFLGFGFLTFVFAQNLSDIIDTLGNEGTFGYTTTQKLSVKEITDDKIIFQSPLIKNSQNQDILTYTVMYTQFPLVEILENTDLLKETKEKIYDLSGSTDPFLIELGVSDGLDISKKYYVFVVPKDQNGNLGEVSNELWFSLFDKAYGDAGSSETFTASSNNHSAAGADMSLANISHTINGSTITLNWIAVEGSSSIDISVLSPDASSFNKISTVQMNDQTYSFVASKNGEYVFQFTPDNAGRQVNYTVYINTISSPTPTPTPGPVIPVVPRTGPTENILFIVFATLFGYFLYKKLYKKVK